MTTDIGSAPQNRSRWLNGGLIASLALNFLFIGGMGAAAWHHRHGGRGDDSGLMSFARELPDDRQKMVREDISAARVTIRPMRNAVRDAWEESNAVLIAEPFDREKFKASMDKLQEAESRFKTAAASALADTAAKLTPDERRILQGWRENHRPHVFGHREAPGSDEKN